MPHGSNVEAFPGTAERLAKMLEEEHLKGVREGRRLEAMERNAHSRHVHQSRVRYHAWWLLPLGVMGLALIASITFGWLARLDALYFFALGVVATLFVYHLRKAEWHSTLLKKTGRASRR